MFFPQSLRSSAGVTIVECLLALLLLSVGLLGATGTVGASWRLMRNGEAATGAARRLLSVVDSLSAAVSLAAGSCAALGTGTVSGAAFEVAWTAGPAPHGREVELTVTYPGRVHRDTILTRIPCE